MHLKRLIRKGLICDGVHSGVHMDFTLKKSNKIKGYFLTLFPEGREFESCHVHEKSICVKQVLFLLSAQISGILILPHDLHAKKRHYLVRSAYSALYATVRRSSGARQIWQPMRPALM